MRSEVGAPIPLAAFVGRAREVEAVRGLLDATRLLTLTGAGGSGKTRIAIEVVQGLSAVAWVELAGISDAARATSEIAVQLGIREVVAGVEDAIATVLRDGPRVLVLDNCEHLIDAVARLVATLLRTCPQLKVLATSREPLALAGERAWLVPALSVPARGAREVDPAHYDAIRLFIERARDVQPSFTVDAATALTIGEICRRLDGLPLAIELAAARVRVLSPEQILARLHDRFKLLASTSRTAAPRHQTLRAAMDWSHALLAPDEQRLFARLAVFGGDFTLDAAEAVCSDDSLDAGAVLDVLARLVDRSLVTMREAGGLARYGLLETVRQYAGERLREVGDEATLRRRHAAYVAGLIATAVPHLTRVTRRGWFERLDREIHDIRAALVWTCEHDHDLHLELVGRLSWYWYSSGAWAEARAWFDGALALPAAQAPTLLRARVLFAAGQIASLQAASAIASAWLEEAMALAKAQGDEDLELYAAAYLGMSQVQELRADSDVILRYAERAFRARHDLYGLRIALLMLGSWRITVAKDVASCAAFYTEGLAVAREFGLPREIGIAAQLLGSATLLLGKYDDAAALLHESITSFQQDPQYYFVARNLDMTGYLLARREGSFAEAARFMGAAQSVRWRVGASLSISDRIALDPVIALLRDRLGPVAYDAAFAEGRKLDPDTALALALEVVKPRTAVPPPVPAPIATASTPGLAVRGLGPLEIRLEDRVIERGAWGSPRARELLLYLLAHPQGRRREDIGLVFWPDASAAQVKNSFHVLLHRLRKVVGRHDVVVVEDERYVINPALEPWFDGALFEREVKAAKRDPDRLAAAVALYRGDLFEGEVAGEWHLEQQDRLRTLHRDALSTLADLRSEDPGAATTLLEELVRIDELREDAHRRLILSYARSGQRDRALLQYERLVEILRAELAAKPSRATVELADKIRRAEAV